LAAGVAWGDSCSNAALRVGPSAALPDCRAYEMVSPLEKGGNAVTYPDARASVSGEGITYLSTGAFDEAKGFDLLDRYLSRRGPSGWSTSNITPPGTTYQAFTGEPFAELFFSPELTRGLLLSPDAPLVSGEPGGYYKYYLWNEGQSSYQTVSTVTPPLSEAEPYFDQPEVAPEGVGASNDLTHVVFEQPASLVEGASPFHVHIYEWAGGKLSMVDVPPEGMTFSANDVVGAPISYTRAYNDDVWHAVSEDGSRVFFAAGEPGPQEGEAAGQLFVRENPMAPQSPSEHGVCTVVVDACTVEVSASQRAVPDPQGPRPAYFRGASADGSLVFFVSYAELTNDANTGPADNAPNLYAYDLNTGVLTDLTVDSNAGDPDGAAVVGLVTAAEDGSYVYFVANGVLADNASGPLHETAQLGTCRANNEAGPPTEENVCNLYVEHLSGSSWEPPRFIARLAGVNMLYTTATHRGNDEEDWQGLTTPSNEDRGPGQHTVRVTPDGTRLAFQSVRSLTGYDNVPVSHEECENERCSVSEVYLYDSLNGSLVCASCDSGGSLPVARAELGASYGEEGEAFSNVSPLYTARNLSTDGNRLFFQSRDPLVPGDTNGRQNVYEWEADGEGSCAQGTGCVLAMSDVSGEDDSFFMDASPNGDDVFITTGDGLVPSDNDGLRDVYDARVDGGFPAAPVAPPACGGADACRGPAALGQAPGSPASAALSGAGNLTPTSPSAPVAKPKPKVKAKGCARGFVRKRGRCVRQKRGKRKGRGSSLRDRALRARSRKGL
jgi:hypothetical protein